MEPTAAAGGSYMAFGEEKEQMNTQVEFRSDKFPPYEAEEEINPGLWARRLAEYLKGYQRITPNILLRGMAQEFAPTLAAR